MQSLYLHPIVIAQVFKDLHNNPNPSLDDLRSLLPQDESLQNQIQCLRDLSAKAALIDIKAAPSSPQRMPSTVQVQECLWGPPMNGAPKKIRILGIRHGVFNINHNTASELKTRLKAIPKGHLFNEQGLGRPLAMRWLPRGKDIKDVDGVKLGSKTKYLQLLALSPIILPVILGRLMHRPIRQIFGPVEQPDQYPDFDLTLRQLGFMPESAEIDAHMQLPPETAADLDKGTLGKLVQGRSAYMAGYLAAQSESTTSNEPITFICGGGHLPRITSCLNFDSRAAMPDSIGRYFDIGYEASKNAP